ncbi:hypothetical protein Bb109J_c1933 [Bdellovibrio bacteriovorus]|uniref:hypothetical protein n=1 Tax=Bdellovibrio bacteriovorus TaxID=959 RepID=UPI00045BE38B|nr:hypothetical protein [Bdellovibrio bacteriovorus]AHZ84623.1 hypothetical protein EP01_06690 [Bdellovibrio bacteriovorus]BEV68513.1 hypothetical protein Bb109J_c1933 [Bdellovibrio bacteriovorus]
MAKHEELASLKVGNQHVKLLQSNYKVIYLKVKAGRSWITDSTYRSAIPARAEFQAMATRMMLGLKVFGR